MDIFKLDVDAIVNPVNCVGAMGAGLALQFKSRYPANFQAYAQACKEKKLAPGGIFAFSEGERVLYNLATKAHWKDPSRIEWIVAGMVELRFYLLEVPWPVESIAIPPLGCGLGGLDWREVKPLIDKYLQGVPQKVIIIDP